MTNTKIQTDSKSLTIRGELYEPKAGIWLEIWIELDANREINDAYVIGVREDFHNVIIAPNVWQMITEYYHFNPVGKMKLKEAADEAVETYFRQIDLTS